MLILLPPSEKKRAGGRGRSLASAQPARTTVAAGAITAGGAITAIGAAPMVRDEPQPSPRPTDLLAEGRSATLTALARLCALPIEQAAIALALPPSLAEEALEINRRVLDGATMPAFLRYDGVVYDGLDTASLTSAQTRLARRQLLIFSGLFGVVGGAEPIPAYRVPAKAQLPGLGVAGTFWRPRLESILTERLGRRGAVLDLRSSDYAAMWRPRGVEADRVISARILSRTTTGYRVVSYNSKYAKGQLARAVLDAQADGAKLTRAEEIVELWRECSGQYGAVVTGRHGPEVELRTD